jgi:epoxyqueuosine reductase QueG
MFIAQCTKCGSYVTDSLESEIEQHGKIKMGNYVNGVWLCNDCIAASQRQGRKREKEEKNLFPFLCKPK